MLKSLSRKMSAALVAIVLTLNFSQVAKAEIIELAIAIDGSGSISPTDFALQADAYSNIFKNNFVTNFVDAADQLYVSVWVFSNSVTQIVGLTHILDDAGASAFATSWFDTLTQPGSLTNTGGVIQAAANDLINNGDANARKIIDISTDGVPTTGPNAVTEAGNAFANGVIVNAIGVGNGIDAGTLAAITGAGGGFFVTAANFGEFQTSLERKLEREIQGIPEPGSILLLGLGASLLAFRRRAA